MRSSKQTAAIVFVSALAGAAAMLLFVNSTFGGTRLTRGEYESYRKTVAVSEALELAEEKFYGTAPEEEALVSAAANGLVEALEDPYAHYYTAEEYESYLQDLSGEYVGIGMTITLSPHGGALVMEVHSGSPAEKAGVQAGDILIKVEGADVTEATLQEITEQVMGKEGTEVALCVLRGEETLNFTMTRAKQRTQQVHYEMLDGEIGYLRIDRFSGDCKEGFQNALAALREAGMRALVVDLRNNPGGALDTVVAVADELLGEGIIVTVKSADGEEEVYRSDPKALGLPLTVLVNGNSASASELLAGAVQDSGAGIVVGTKTYGKGVVQTTWKLRKSGSWLKLTTAAYYTPAGRNIDGEGINPDITVSLAEGFENVSISSLPQEEDAQLAKALEWIEDTLQSE